MSDVRLTPAQERVLRAADAGEVREFMAPNRRGSMYRPNVRRDTLTVIRKLGLLTLDVNEMGKRVRHFRPTDAGRQWLADHPEES